MDLVFGRGDLIWLTTVKLLLKSTQVQNLADSCEYYNSIWQDSMAESQLRARRMSNHVLLRTCIDDGSVHI